MLASRVLAAFSHFVWVQDLRSSYTMAILLVVYLYQIPYSNINHQQTFAYIQIN